MAHGGYYVTSFTYRVIRPLAIAELIERQIAFADSSVDPQVLDLLRFKAAAKAMLCDAEVIFDDKKADWTRQREHFFSGKFGGLARSGLADEPDSTVRVLREEEFGKVIDERRCPPTRPELASLTLPPRRGCGRASLGTGTSPTGCSAASARRSASPRFDTRPSS